MNKIGLKHIVLLILVFFAIFFTACRNVAKFSNTYTIIYNSNASDVTGTMANSVFTVGVSQQLRPNAFIRDGHVFIGWTISAGELVIYADGVSVTDLVPAREWVTLYAMWEAVTYVPGETLAAQLDWLESNAETNINYLIKVRAHEEISPRILSYNGRKNVTIRLKGIGSIWTISLISLGSLFTVGPEVTLILENNITLHGHKDNGNSLIHVGENRTLVMNTGTKIIGNSGGGVSVDRGGTFTMNGGEISGNTSTSVSANDSYAQVLQM
ncbi:MAG: InlB B-repeat-containing protein [Treponema sp.]|nr:InlB B-repeat-containing protein [Treponema sp.]